MDGPFHVGRHRLAAAVFAVTFACVARVAGEPPGQPRPAAAPAPEVRLPADVTYSEADGSPGPVVFSHTFHVPLAQERCLSCHPGLFSILQPTRGLAHEVMNAGRQCGACHDGRQAGGVEEACDHCHRMGGE